MEEIIHITYLNDFIYCPVSIYFHKLYGSVEGKLYKREYQIDGTAAHKAIDNKTYSTRKILLQGIDVYSDKYQIEGKIDIFNVETGELIERKNKINAIYDGYIFQIYAQYYALIEMGYDVKILSLYSICDNKKYNVKLPNDDEKMQEKFEKIIKDIRKFEFEKYEPQNIEKCRKCIYEPVCDRSLIC